MTFALKRGDTVIDIYFPRWKTGIVRKVTKTSITVAFDDRDHRAYFPSTDGTRSYDKNTVQFLKPVKARNKGTPTNGFV